MKILHLSDLHIGKIIYEQSLLEDQEYMLKQIEKIIEKEKIEAVLISGDIYDRSIPPADAVDILNKFLNTLIKILKVKSIYNIRKSRLKRKIKLWKSNIRK